MLQKVWTKRIRFVGTCSGNISRLSSALVPSLPLGVLSPAPGSLESADGFIWMLLEATYNYQRLLDFLPNMCASHVTLRNVGMYVYVAVDFVAIGD
ncbi:hypothetical protein Nepgr_018812 [Nepenthes gracilis]|uniref:Uncharacterized protein n=1 Tax=Nepenthes gracilis TaxID=150966 RepID=A0AAD3SVX2_NEPGR|nr:hypothetical protein Nepgr_018812 [Nepenthes gracilis]